MIMIISPSRVIDVGHLMTGSVSHGSEPYMMPLTDTWEENDDPTLEGCYEYDETE